MTIYSLPTQTNERLRSDQSSSSVLLASGTLWMLIRYASAIDAGKTALPPETDHEDLLVARMHAQYRLSRAVLCSLDKGERGSYHSQAFRVPQAFEDTPTLTGRHVDRLREAQLAQDQTKRARKRLAQPQPFSYHHELILRAALVHVATYPEEDWQVREARMVAASRGYQDLLGLQVLAVDDPVLPTADRPARTHEDCAFLPLIQ